MKNVLILKAGDANPKVAIHFGDYDTWFPLTLSGEGHRYQVVEAHRGAALPARARDFDAVLMTGSPLSVTEPEGWMLRAGEWMLEAAERRVPVLGVCFGHQLLGHVLGTQVVQSERGREIGTVEVLLTAEGRSDPLFEGLPERVAVQTTHDDVLCDLPRGACLLACNDHARVQAFALGPYLRGVQFHPEIGPEVMGAMIALRAGQLEAAAIARGSSPGQRVRELEAGVRPTPSGRRILQNFLHHFG
jgi:GMP synthase (glutamine-hydrolysing)